MNYAPVAIFCYSRPDHTKRMLKSLHQNKEFSSSPVTIYHDGLKSESHRDDWTATAKIIREFAPKHAELIFRDKNWGLAPSIIEGVTEQTKKHGRVIVIEDDLVLASGFLDFMNRSLDYYKNHDKVFHVSGYMFPVFRKLPDLFFYREVTCWGWGTWSRAWAHFESDSTKLLERISKELDQDEFDIGGTMGFLGMLKAQNQGRVNSWAIRWYASVSLAKGLCLHPGVSLVSNDGFDGTGVHCSETSHFEVNRATTNVANFPNEVMLSQEALEAMKEYRTLLFNNPSKLKKIKSNLYRLFQNWR